MPIDPLPPAPIDPELIDPLPPVDPKNCPAKCLLFYTECNFKGEELKVCSSTP